MSSSCAWYKLFEIRRLIFHIGNPTMYTQTNIYIYRFKKLEVDLVLKRSSQLQVQVVVHLLLPWFSVTPLAKWRFAANNELGCKWNSFCDCIFVPKGSVTLAIFMYYWMDSENYSMHYWLIITFGKYSWLCFFNATLDLWPSSPFEVAGRGDLVSRPDYFSQQAPKMRSGNKD